MPILLAGVGVVGWQFERRRKRRHERDAAKSRDRMFAELDEMPAGALPNEDSPVDITGASRASLGLSALDAVDVDELCDALFNQPAAPFARDAAVAAIMDENETLGCRLLESPTHGRRTSDDSSSSLDDAWQPLAHSRGPVSARARRSSRAAARVALRQPAASHWPSPGPQRNRRPSGKRRGRWGIAWLAARLLVAGLFALRSPLEQTSVPSMASTPAQATSNIEDIRVGQRVLADNPEFEDFHQETAVDPATWKLLRLHAEDRWEDGTRDTIEIETLQPLTWLARCGAEVGVSVPIPLDLVEMGLPEDLLAEVTAIEPCPPIQPGAGRVVLTTVNHLNPCILALTVENEDGQRETINPTGFHRDAKGTLKGTGPYIDACAPCD